ncbi:Histidine kinase, Hpt domain-containing [Desulfonema limicola]|uniref:Chemotaxis protein CheA n=1 Tax=Desulfonema limicola TaxID=45656 RepID=A0A975BF09_9BACT|nr:chemotaxis protein CheA [Desulfonema limicola]QTA83949.1 Histidine kinase, Hpt domain-containing [Desulfonema limicola]
MNKSDSLKNIFRQEASELIADIEENLLNIEKDPENKDFLDSLFRPMHTLKGSGAVSGFNDIADFTHNIETVLDRVRSGLIPVTRELIDLIFKSIDQIKIMLKEDKAAISESKNTVSDIISKFEKLAHDNNIQEIFETQETEPEPAPLNPCSETNKNYTIEFYPGPEIFAAGIDPLLLIDELRELGLCMVEARMSDIPIVHSIDPEKCYLSWNFTLTTSCGIDAVKDVFMFVEHSSRIKIQEIETSRETLSDLSEQGLFFLCEKLLETGYITAYEFNETMSGRKNISDTLVDAGVVSQQEVKSGLSTSEIIQKSEKGFKDSTIRVALDKLDHLVNLVGELTITQSQITRITSEVKDARLRKPLKTAERLTGELRNIILSVRMIPIGTTFGKFRRYLRDMANKLEKDIELITAGGDAELDKTVIEKLNDPLIHIIRNSIDHGIEKPGEREKKGKSPKGTIKLSAVQKGSRVCINIEDDGTGLDPEKILLKAEKMGLSYNKDLSEKEIFNLLFLPGLSTSEQITNLSGRGVGMDVVKKAVDSLHGTIQINSKKGHGTNIEIALPLTLAIIDGLMIETGGNFFILPMGMVDKCIEIVYENNKNQGNRNIICIKKEVIPLIPLREIFEIPGKRPDIEQVVIIDAENFKAGIVTDRVIGDHQTVVKPLGKTFKNAEGLSGATFTGDGNIALILDIPGLIRCAQQSPADKTPEYLYTRIFNKK